MHVTLLDTKSHALACYVIWRHTLSYIQQQEHLYHTRAKLSITATCLHSEALRHTPECFLMAVQGG